MKLKLFHKIALFSILLATLPAAIVGWQTATLNREHLENNILELHTNLANSLARRIDFYLDGVTGKLRALIESLRIQGISSPASIQAFLDSNHEFVSFSFVNASGREIMKTVNEIYGEGQSFVSHADDPLFKTYAAQEAGGVIDPKFMLYFEKGEPRLKIFYPYDPSSIKRGSLMIVISLRELWDDILSEGAGVGGGGRHIFIADQFGNLIAHSDPSTMKKILESGPIPAPDHPLVREALQARTIGSKEFKDSMGQDMVGSYALVKWTGWVSAIQQQKKGAFAPIYQTRTRAWIVIILSILLAGVSAIYLSKGLSRPIFEIIEAARKVAENNFDQQVKISSDDELGNLAETFNEMVWALRSYHDLQVDRIIEEKTKTESVIFSIADGLIMTDHTGKIQIMNQRAAHVFDLDGDRSKQANPWNWVGKNILDVIKDDSVHEVLKKALMESGSQTKEITMTHGEDVRHYQMSSESVVNPKTGANLGVVTVVHDVTLERELDKMKETFLHSITHDLRNPMTSIQGFVKILIEQKSGPLNDAQKSMLATMERASMRFLSMINDILDIAKVEAGKMEIEVKKFDLNPMIESLHSLYQPMADKRQIQFDVSWNVSQKPFSMTGDENQLERVTGNLIANALKFTPMNGKINLRVEEFPDKIQISVTDSGPGIPESHRKSIFDKFQQLGPGKQKGGTGLGLTISKHFIELHKGQIWVEAGDGGQGSKFAFWIPRNLAV